MKKKGVLGGTFDPIHNGHLHIAYEALYRLQLDEIIFMPSGNPPHKKEKDITNAETRYLLVKTAIEDEEKFNVSDYEIESKGYSYTYKTVEHLYQVEADTEWYFITGADCLMELDAWKNVEGIFEKCNFVVFTRAGYSKEQLLTQKRLVEEKYDKEIIFLDMPLIDISSTFIREKISNCKEVSYLIPWNLHNKIKELRLYKKS
ncbi:nicotinate-nucleotide adenylyltransferase [Clostridium sediminicola]|uniref:nicotinate-nucleotide adenylyltransferase n=1 Tax=Clostridium sediminicola TaxID=3114879 RepID=UPI0031F2326C